MAHIGKRCRQWHYEVDFVRRASGSYTYYAWRLPLTPLEALQCEMEEQGLNQAMLAKHFGMSKGTISEVLNGKKKMSLTMLKYLHKDLGIPANVLLA